MKVWDILNREKYTEEGQQYFEKIENIIDSIGNKITLNELDELWKAIDEHLFETMDLIQVKFLEKNGDSRAVKLLYKKQ
jgi:hypothetical protein